MIQTFGYLSIAAFILAISGYILMVTQPRNSEFREMAAVFGCGLTTVALILWIIAGMMADARDANQCRNAGGQLAGDACVVPGSVIHP